MQGNPEPKIRDRDDTFLWCYMIFPFLGAALSAWFIVKGYLPVINESPEGKDHKRFKGRITVPKSEKRSPESNGIKEAPAIQRPQSPYAVDDASNNDDDRSKSKSRRLEPMKKKSNNLPEQFPEEQQKPLLDGLESEDGSIVRRMSGTSGFTDASRNNSIRRVDDDFEEVRR